MNTVTVRLPCLNPAQALALWEALVDLESALWEAYEPLLIPLVTTELRPPVPPEPTCDTGEDDIPF